MRFPRLLLAVAWTAMLVSLVDGTQGVADADEGGEAVNAQRLFEELRDAARTDRWDDGVEKAALAALALGYSGEGENVAAADHAIDLLVRHASERGDDRIAALVLSTDPTASIRALQAIAQHGAARFLPVVCLLIEIGPDDEIVRRTAARTVMAIASPGTGR